MPSSPPSSTALRTPQSAAAALPPTRFGRQRKQVEKFGSMMDSDLIVDHVSDYSGDEGRWDDEDEEETEEEEQSFSKGVKEVEDDDDMEDVGEDEDEDDDKKSKKSRKAKSSSSKASRSSKPKGKKESITMTKAAVKKTSSTKLAAVLPKPKGKKPQKAVAEDEEENEGSEAEPTTTQAKGSGKSKVQAKPVVAKKVSVPAKRSHSPAPSDTETLTGEQEEKADDAEEHDATTSSPPPSKKAKVTPLAAKSSSISFPKAASKPAIKPKVGVTVAPKAAQHVKPVPKGRGGGLTLIKKTDSAVSTPKAAPTAKSAPSKAPIKAIKESSKKAAPAKKVVPLVQQEEDKDEKEEQDDEEMTKDEAAGEATDVDMEEPVEAKPAVPLTLSSTKSTGAAGKFKAGRNAGTGESVAPLSSSGASASDPPSKKVVSSAKGKGKQEAAPAEEEAEVEEESQVEVATGDEPENQGDEASQQEGGHANEASDGLYDVVTEPSSTPVKKGKRAPPAKSTSRTSSDSSTKAVEKITAIMRGIIIEALKQPAYLKSVDFKLAAKPFGDECDHTKLSRHWNQVLSVDLLGYFAGTVSKKPSKASAKGALGKDHRLAIWSAVLEVHNKADWDAVSKAAGGMGGDKLKRHLKQVMDKQAKKYISGA